MLIDPKPIILLNSIQRTGNTFLAFAVSDAITKNLGPYKFLDDFDLQHHSHSRLLLNLDIDNCFQYSNFRHPDELIPSLAFFHNSEPIEVLVEKYSLAELERHVYDQIKNYAIWMDNALKNPAVKIVMFDKMKNDINYVVEKILSDVGISHSIPIVDKEIKDTITRINNDRYTTAISFEKNHHLPRGINETAEYKIYQNIYNKSKYKSELINLYLEIEKRAI